MKAYIAGPMRGYPEFNFPAFFSAEEELLEVGLDVFNPARYDVETGFDPAAPLPAGYDMRETAARDLAELLACDAIYMLLGWKYSAGATAERAVALWVGLEIWGAAE